MPSCPSLYPTIINILTMQSCLCWSCNSGWQQDCCSPCVSEPWQHHHRPANSRLLKQQHSGAPANVHPTQEVLDSIKARLLLRRRDRLAGFAGSCLMQAHQACKSSAGHVSIVAGLMSVGAGFRSLHDKRYMFLAESVFIAFLLLYFLLYIKCPYAYPHVFACSLPHEHGNWRQAPAWQNITHLCKFCFEMVHCCSYCINMCYFLEAFSSYFACSCYMHTWSVIQPSVTPAF